MLQTLARAATPRDMYLGDMEIDGSTALVRIARRFLPDTLEWNSEELFTDALCDSLVAVLAGTGNDRRKFVMYGFACSEHQDGTEVANRVFFDYLHENLIGSGEPFGSVTWNSIRVSTIETDDYDKKLYVARFDAESFNGAFVFGLEK